MPPRVLHVEKPVNKMAGLKEDKETPLEKSNTSVMNVGKSSVRAQIFSDTGNDTLEKKPHQYHEGIKAFTLSFLRIREDRRHWQSLGFSGHRFPFKSYKS